MKVSFIITSISAVASLCTLFALKKANEEIKEMKIECLDQLRKSSLKMIKTDEELSKLVNMIREEVDDIHLKNSDKENIQKGISSFCECFAKTDFQEVLGNLSSSLKGGD